MRRLGIERASVATGPDIAVHPVVLVGMALVLIGMVIRLGLPGEKPEHD